jgi:uncharacterized protein (TIGR04255 family)
LFELFLLSLEDAEDVSVRWCELTYINPIPAPGASPDTHGQLAHILNYLERDPPRETLPDVEDTQIQQRFRLNDSDGNPIGRLYVIAVPGYQRTDNRPIYVVTVMARGRPESDELPNGVIAFMNRAHGLIVNGFKEVTTEEMHAEWGIEPS